MHLNDIQSKSQPASSHPSEERCTVDMAFSDLLLPEYLRLGAHNWFEFKLAIETILRLRGISLTHLRCPKCPPPLPVTHSGTETNRASEKSRAQLEWAAEEDLCKTIIVLNVRGDHMRLVEYNYASCSTAELWALLVQRDEDIRKEWERKVGWLDCIRTLAPWVFLVIVCAAWLMGA
ncbi:hypothetical protein GSI_13026 [Ganoderma sinense ZZ0214-1]|uniref:Uncharacterized protein n=1 Tax=Ganoderma sinense ZZ0214-1 TaxID=1077348 RepID=A0A2G8RUE8_9APHY|nr:hypothetical protein GSI_13026 [Ganoderma sinense ZZ0214-1]